jgi:glycosyltransferase
MFSIITVTKNSAKTIKTCVDSVKRQDFNSVEHIIKDACSTDNTRAIAESGNIKIKFFSSHDIGIYDAMNQGFRHAKGDFIGFLNSDDKYIDEKVLSKVAIQFEKTLCDFVYGDILMVNHIGTIVRNWRPGPNLAMSIKDGQIPHPALFIRKSVLLKIAGPFDPSYRIAGDLKQQLILVNNLKARGQYLSEPLVLMAIGGASTRNFKSYFNGWSESYRAWCETGGVHPYAFVFRKVFSKLKGVQNLWH